MCIDFQIEKENKTVAYRQERRSGMGFSAHMIRLRIDATQYPALSAVFGGSRGFGIGGTG